MSYYDYALKFTDEAAAIAAAEGTTLGQRDAQNVWHWNTHFVLPNMRAWRISQDMTNPDGSITHTYLAGWFCIVSTKNQNAQLANHPNLQFALDRDGPPWIVKNNIGAIISDVNCEPVFAGTNYPRSGWGP